MTLAKTAAQYLERRGRPFYQEGPELSCGCQGEVGYGWCKDNGLESLGLG